MSRSRNIIGFLRTLGYAYFRTTTASHCSAFVEAVNYLPSLLSDWFRILPESCHLRWHRTH